MTNLSATTIDPNEMLVPKIQRSQPDFNLLSSENPEDLKLIEEAMSKSNPKSQPEKEREKKDSKEGLDVEKEFAKMKAKEYELMMTDKKPDKPLEGWDQWTGPDDQENAKVNGISRRLMDEQYFSKLTEWKRKKDEQIQRRSDYGMDHLILSQQVSKQSAKYLLLGKQPKWFNPFLYRSVMDEQLGREFNTSTEFYESIKPDINIPMGHVVTPTHREDGKEPFVPIKTKFGKKKHLHSKNASSLPKLFDAKPHNASKSNPFSKFELPEKAKV